MCVRSVVLGQVQRVCLGCEEGTGEWEDWSINGLELVTIGVIIIISLSTETENQCTRIASWKIFQFHLLDRLCFGGVNSDLILTPVI